MILIFGGTTEGRIAIDVCEQAGKPFYYSTKSDLQQVELHNGIRHCGAMTSDDIIRFCETNGIRCLVDATHPFAQNVHQAIAKVNLPLIRLQRPTDTRMEGVVYCDSYEEAVEKMENANIKLLLALSGVNTILKLKSYWQSHPTLFRILQRKESMDIAEKNGLQPSQIIFYNDAHHLPSKDKEKQLMENIGCDAILTKESGENGGFKEKVGAALELGLKVFALKTPSYTGLIAQRGRTADMRIVCGKHGLRRAVEQFVPDFFPLKTGFTTGSCATAATKAAMLSLIDGETPETIDFALPDGEIMSIPVEVEVAGKASVVKDFSDDPDVTRGCRITAEVKMIEESDIIFLQGEGVGKVTFPGLGIPVGGPAINATPRQMIVNELRNLTDKGCTVTISVENGRELARHTFNEKVGVVDGISIIGTSGIVSPLSNEAFVESIGRELEVAKAIGHTAIGLASGKKGEEALLNLYPDLRIIHYGNFIGEALKKAHQLGFERVDLGIMIGKAVKLAEGHLDTHSHKVQMNKGFLKSIADDEADKIDRITMARELWKWMSPTFFDHIKALCLQYCKTVFPQGELNIHLICDETF